MTAFHAPVQQFLSRDFDYIYYTPSYYYILKDNPHKRNFILRSFS